MPFRKIAQIGHPVLRQKARPLTREELLAPATQQLIDDMIDTMRDAQGAGLAAIQVYEPVRIAVVEVTQNARYPYKPPIPLTILVNPELTPIEDERFDNYEGCLSVPDLRGVVPRYTQLRARSWDRHGNVVDRVVKGLEACTYQHEVDHLDGVLFVDRVVDRTTFSTWKDWERFHKEPFVARVRELVAKHGS
jgi:peptide deformylase